MQGISLPSENKQDVSTGQEVISTQGIKEVG
jgi:hypothetical protein